MKISPINYNNFQQNTNFKAAFPVAHWVAEANGSYAPVALKADAEIFQQKILDIIQSSLKKVYNDAKKLENQLNKKNLSEQEKSNIKRKLKSLYEILDVPAQNLRNYLAKVDIDYRLNPKARSFYNVVHGSIDSPSSTTYIITGNLKDFDKKFTEELGRQRSIKKKLMENGATEEEAETPAYKAALHKYNYEGLDYVNYYPRRIKDSNGTTQTLHTKFEIERDQDGKFMGYKFIDARFLPERGPNSPFEKLKMNC